MPTGTTTLASARRHVSNMQRRVERAVAVGQPERARRLRRMILLSYEARLAAVYRAHRRGPLSPERARHLLDVIEWIGPERLLIATDYPHWDFDDPSQALPRAEVGANFGAQAKVDATMRSAIE